MSIARNGPVPKTGTYTGGVGDVVMQVRTGLLAAGSLAILAIGPKGGLPEHALAAPHVAGVFSQSGGSKERTWNVRKHGVKGDGVTDDHRAIQALVERAPPGQVLHFPAGTYRIGSVLTLRRSGLTLRGEGSATVIDHRDHGALEIGPGKLTNVVIQKLRFRGMPGKYIADGNTSKCIMVIDPQQVMIEGCEFIGSGFAYFSTATDAFERSGVRWPVTIKSCKVRGWGASAVFLRGGETVRDCSLVQDDPSRKGRTSQHGLYIANACDVTVTNTTIENARAHAFQIYGQKADFATDRVVLRRVVAKNCFQGGVIAPAGPSRGVTLEDCQITGTWDPDSPALVITKGERIRLRRNTLDGGPEGIRLFGDVRDLLAEDNVIRNCKVGIRVETAYPGKFSDVIFKGSRITDCGVSTDLAGASGITVVRRGSRP